MARALIVGCGCRGRELGARLTERDWLVRGTTRDPARTAAIEAAGVEAVVADPDRPATILAQVADVTVVVWALGSARGEEGAVAAIHGPRLERLLEKLVDAPVRGFVYDGEGSVPAAARERGAALVREASQRWRIPARVTGADPQDHSRWVEEVLEAINGVLSER